ncbi:hypothetical protein AAG596_00595 [Citromicrobium bathyomarinum]
MALLIKGSAAEGHQTLFLSSTDDGHADAVSSGGWIASGAPDGSNVGFLVGHADFCERHGIELGNRREDR